MSQKILAFSGSKQSGKTTRMNFLHGYEMKRTEAIKVFEINNAGKLVVNATTADENGNISEGMGVLDIERNDFEFANYASQRIWPFVRAYNFATPLKRLCVSVFGLKYEQCYGTEDEKNSPTNIMWESLPDSLRSKDDSGPMSAREFLQYFGTDICRRIKPDIWTSICLDNIVDDESELAIIGDCRFRNEADAIHEAGGKIIRLLRKPKKDSHSSENDLEKYCEFDHVIDNSDMTIEECNKELLNVLIDWGWIQSVEPAGFTKPVKSEAR
jgi:hypothetical protein